MKRIKITLPEGGRRIGELGSNVGLNRGVSFELQAEKIIIEGDVTFSGNVNAPTLAPLPFDLEAAKAGAPLVTRGGRKARFLAHVPEACQSAKLIAMIEGAATACCFHENGRITTLFDDKRDLFMAPKPKRTVWVNIYPSTNQYETEAEAISMGDHRRIATVPVEIDA